MNINEYLAATGMSAYDIATLCKVSHTLVYRLINGQSISRKSAVKINRKTKVVDLETMVKGNNGTEDTNILS